MIFFSRTPHFLFIAFALFLIPDSYAMLSNLQRPYDSKPSPPHEEKLVFWSPKNESFFFEKEKEIEIHCRAGLRSVGLKWTLSRNQFRKPFAEGVADSRPENLFIIRIATGSLTPGFYDLRVELDSGDAKTLPGICTFGFRAGQMPLTLARPSDFKEFWDRGKKELDKVAFDPKIGEVQLFNAQDIALYNMTKAALPADYDPTGHKVEEVESSKLSLTTLKGERVYSWLAKPKGKGPFPAMLVLPGAGFAAQPRPLEHARHGYLALNVQVHGQEVDQEKYERLPGYYDKFVYEPAEAYYFYKVYLNTLQALRYLYSREDVDKNRIVLVGGSQGGRLAIVLAALEPRVRAIVPGIINSGNQPYILWYKNSNLAEPQQDGMDRAAPPRLPDTPEGRCLGYYDPMSFAPDVRCSVFMNVGLIDPVSPPSSVFGIFQQLGSKEKQIIPLPGLGHDWSADFDRRAWRWLEEKLKLVNHPVP